MPPLAKSPRLRSTVRRGDKPARPQSRGTAGSNALYWGIAAVLGGVAAVYAYVKTSGPTLDRGVSPDERKAITFAFYHEKNVKNLQEFGQSLLPNLPVASKLLLDKVAKLQTVAPNSAAPSSVFSKPGGLSPVKTSRISGVSVGNIFDVDNYTDAVSKVVSTTVDVVTHPADTASGTWHAITHPSDSISDFGNALVDALHAIPGMNEAGELLKDFAKTGFGEWCLRILASFGYYALAPYMGAQLAAVSFALPGAAKAEPFTQSWITETIDRVVKTINILLQQEGLKNIGSATSEALNKALAESPAFQGMAKAFTEQIGKASNVLTDKLGTEIAKKIKDGASDALSSTLKKLGAEYGLPPDFSKLAREAGIREDNAAAAYDLLAKTHYQTTTLWDPVTGEDIEGHLRRARFQSVDRAGQTASVQVYQDPRMMTVQQAVARRDIYVSSLLNPPARKKWTDYYLNQERYAEAGVKAKANQPTAAIGSDPIAAPGMPTAGSYMIEFEAYPAFGNPQSIAEMFARNGVQVTGLRSTGTHRYRLFVRTPRPMILQNIPSLRWLLSRKLPG
jgi:hypothetical protein